MEILGGDSGERFGGRESWERCRGEIMKRDFGGEILGGEILARS